MQENTKEVQSERSTTQENDATKRLSTAFGYCMDELGYEETARALASILLVSVKATQKDTFYLDDVMGEVRVDINTSPRLHGQASPH